MSPKSDQIIYSINGINRFIYRIFPTSQLSRRIDVVRLDISSKMPLGFGIELDHGVC